ncbi:hypothetical protein [Streptomyces sp. NPDC056682]|uniref:hypothetical protein n=1 Tax=Streptomyces sp. NPDC056682 TaxID=3345909 RepID=UPI00368381FD
MSEDMQREARQRALIAQALGEYRRGASALGGLSQDLQVLVLELQLAPKEWLAAFQAEVNELEVLYAIALDRGITEDLPADYRADADATVRNLEALLEQLAPPAPDEA